MENIIDWDEFEEDLTQKAGTKKMWVSIFAIVGILAITYFAAQMRFNGSEFDGTFGSGWNFDYNMFFGLMLGSVSTVVITGLKIQAGLSKVISRQRIIAEKDKTLAELKQKISEALDKIVGADGMKPEVKPPCPKVIVGHQ